MREPVADLEYFGASGRIYPYDIRFDPADRGFWDRLDDGRLRIRLLAEHGFSEAAMVVRDDPVWSVDLVRSVRERRFDHWEGVVDPPAGTLSFSFALRRTDGQPVYLSPSGVTSAIERLDTWTVPADHPPAFRVPEWARGAVVYQIFPDRFRNGDHGNDPPGTAGWDEPPHGLRFQGGDLGGVREGIDHLRSLGVEVVYLNPIFTSPSTHRYDTVDYYAVDPAVGGDEALHRLVEALHAAGMRILLDASFNHCHPRFFAFADLLRNGPASDYAGWFSVREQPPRIKVRRSRLPEVAADPDAYGEYLDRLEERTGVRVENVDDAGPIVEPTYEAWYGVPTMPRIDLSHPEARAYFLDVAAYWLREFDVDGWRMDVVRYVDPDFWNDFRRVAKSAKPDCLLLAEVMGDASAWLQGDRFDATMNYTFRDLLVEFLARGSMGSATFADGLARLFHRYAESATEVNHNLIGSHDKQRFLTAAGGETWRLVLATVVQMTFPGAPGIYYGDEIGMTGANDPHCRATFRWDPDTWNREVFEATAALGRLRRDLAVLRRGTWSVLWTGGEALAYERRLGEERVVVVLNRGEALDGVRVEWMEGGQPEVLWGDATVEKQEGTLVVGLAARSAVVLGGPTGDRSPESGTVAADG